MNTLLSIVVIYFELSFLTISNASFVGGLLIGELLISNTQKSIVKKPKNILMILFLSIFSNSIQIQVSINGKMNNQSTIDKQESGINEGMSMTSQAEDTIVNIVGDTLVRHYIVDRVDIFYTHHKSYRAYVKVKVSKDNVNTLISEIKSDKKLSASNKKQNKLSKKVKEVLKNID